MHAANDLGDKHTSQLRILLLRQANRAGVGSSLSLSSLKQFCSFTFSVTKPPLGSAAVPSLQSGEGGGVGADLLQSRGYYRVFLAVTNISRGSV